MRSREEFFQMSAFNQGYSAHVGVDYNLCRDVIGDFVRDYITSEPSGEKRLYEFDIVAKVNELYPETERLGLIKFLGMFIEALLVSGRSLRFDRDGKRTFFTKIHLRDSDSNMAPKADKPDREPRAPIAPDVLEAFEGHIKQADDDTRLRVRDVKVIHSKLNIPENYGNVLKKLQALNGVSWEEEVGNGKTRRYLIGLALTKSGKKLLAE